MTLWTTAAGTWLLQGALSTGDTLVMKTVPQQEGAFRTIASVASGLMSIALLVLTVFLVPAAWNFRKSYKRVNDLLDRVYGDVNPILRHVSTISDNVDYITTSIRTDIQQVNRTIAEANQRLNHALALSEQRLNEFNALLQVVQQEAENTFVATASAVRGVRAGAVTFRREGLAPGAAEYHDDQPDDQELADGDDSPTAPDRGPGPRIRPRPRGRDTA
jgi:uncharacterized protein YoxC